MKIVIPGGSGQVGSILSGAFVRDGHEVVVLSRGAAEDPAVRIVPWDGKTLGNWCTELEGADVVINLAGRTVNCRYHAANRREIMASRVDSTHAIGLAIRQAARSPRIWLQASTATIYAHRYDEANDEESGQIGGFERNVPDTWRFSIEVAKAWEHAATEGGPLPHTRLALLRSAIIMSPDAGGAFDTLLGLVRHGLGGQSGNGRQFVSWIHETDFVRAVRWLIDRDDVLGPVNLAAPNPLPNTDFMRALREAWGIRFGLPATEWMLEIGALFLQTETELVLKSRRVVPGRLLRDGFRFEYSEWPAAARELCQRWRAQRCAKHGS
ncbi:MAG TPA: TIGR01777 family oxidoreductase [Chthoniobacteraceae bacterium]